MANQIQLLVLDDGIIRGMLGDQRFAEALPCLGAIRNALSQLPKGKCSRCKAREARQQSASLIVQARNCIANAPAAQRALLKQLTGARSIRVIRQNPQGAQVRVTF